jgi:autotransporter translocation and assembly factor TamB
LACCRLFNRGVGQLSAGEGLQLAAAAATLAGGGPGVLDKLRGSLGLDWFRLGSSPTSPTTGTLNQRAAASSSGAGGTALSAGKYIAPGVSVGDDNQQTERDTEPAKGRRNQW